MFDLSGEFRESQCWNLAPNEEVGEVLRHRFEWEPALVWVKQFRIPLGAGQPRNPMQATLVCEEGFGVAPIPLDWQSSLDDPGSLGAEQDDFAAMVQGWVDRGNFALYWGNEYHLDGNGEVVGS